MYLICYDIENDRLRTKTAEQLQYLGMIRMQKSVFAGDLERHHLTMLEAWFQKNIKPYLATDDQIAILRLGAEQMASMKHLNKVPEGWDDLLEPPLVLIL